MVRKSRHLTQWDTGKPCPRKLMTGPCAHPKVWEVIHGQRLPNSAGVNQLLNTSQPHAPMRVSNVCVMVGWHMESKMIQMNKQKPPLLISWLLSLSLLTTPTTPRAYNVLPPTLKWPTHFPTVPNNASATSKKSSFKPRTFCKWKIIGEVPWSKCPCQLWWKLLQR